MLIRLAAALGAVVAITAAAHAQTTSPSATGGGVAVTRIGEEGSRLAQAIWAGDTLYVSGQLPTPDDPGDMAKGIMPTFEGDTEAQTTSVLSKISDILKAQGLGMADIVQMQVFMAADPAKENHLDFAGMNAGYAKFFGTPDQPHKPTRAAMQVAALVVPTALVEIVVVAVRPKS